MLYQQGCCANKPPRKEETMVINHNISALFAQRSQKFNGISAEKNMEKLSSGLRINRAGDDASGLAVSEKMRAQIRGLNRAERNAADGISMIQTAEGYLDETTQVLQRLRELAIQSANGIYSSEDRTYIQVEVSQLVDEVNRIARGAQFNGLNLLTGRFAQDTGANSVTASMWLHIGANVDQRIDVHIGTMTAQGLGLQEIGPTDDAAAKLSLMTQNESNRALATIDAALEKVSKQRADLGAYQSRLDLTRIGLAIGEENLQAAESRIRDAVMSREIVDLTKNQILSQTATAMLTQANAQSSQVLQLLRG